MIACSAPPSHSRYKERPSSGPSLSSPFDHWILLSQTGLAKPWFSKNAQNIWLILMRSRLAPSTPHALMPVVLCWLDRFFRDASKESAPGGVTRHQMVAGLGDTAVVR